MKSLFLSLVVGLFFSTSVMAADGNSATPTSDESQLAITVSEPNSLTATVLNHPELKGGNQYYSFDFGPTPLMTSRWARFTLTSTGRVPLYIRSIELYGANFFARHNCPNELPPGYRCEALVEFRPWFEGAQTGQLIFNTTAANFITNLYGYGVR